MLRHDYIANDHKSIPLTHLVQDCEKSIAGEWLSEQRLSAIATEGDEVKVSVTVVTFEMGMHPTEMDGKDYSL